MPLELLIFVTSALAVLALLSWRGMLSERAFADAPQRAVNFGGIDLLVGTGIFLLCMVVGQAVFALVGLDGDVLTSPQRVLQGLLAQAAVQLPLVIYFIARAGVQHRGWREAGLLPRRPLRELGSGLLGLLAAIALVFGLNILILTLSEAAGYPPPQVGHDLLRVAQELRESPLYLAMLAISATIFAPLFEEIIFRGWLQTSLLGLFGRQRRWLAIIMASIVFVALHVGMPWQVLPGLFVLSLALGWLYERTGSLWPSIVLHAGFNALNLGMTLLAGEAPAPPA